MLKIDEAILLNQLAQRVAGFADGARWFDAHSTEGKRRILRELNFLVLQASPSPEDSAAAISESGLRRTLTPCVLIEKQNLRIQLAKLAELPEPELSQAFRLLVELLRIADGRRRKEKPLDLVNHWWHRDLADPQVVEKIRRDHQ